MKHISEDRVTHYIYETDKYLNDTGKVEFNFGTGKVFETSLSPNSSFDNNNFERFLHQEDIFNANEENINEIFSKIQEYIRDYGFVTRCIEYALKIRPKQTESLCSLLSKISKITKYVPSNNLLEEHKKILIQKGIIKGNKDNSRKDKLFEEGSVESAIRDDLVEKLIKLSSQSDFNPKRKLKINKKQAIYFVTEDIDLEDWHKRDILVSYMQLMVYFGAIKCFKYALMDGSFDEDELSKYAIAGGNKDIIHLLEQKDVSFDDCFVVSVKFNRDDISDWLLRNYKCEELELSCTVEYFNNRAFYFFVKNRISSSQDSLNKALHSASKIGHIELVKYLVEHCHADVETKSKRALFKSGRTALHYASENGHLNVVKYLVEECKANVGEKSIGGLGGGKAALHYASEKGHLNVIQYLVEECKVDVGGKDGGITALRCACSTGQLSVVKYLVEECKANVGEKDKVGKTALHYASENGHLNVVQYLVEKCNANVGEKDIYDNTALDFARGDAKDITSVERYPHPLVIKYLEGKMQCKCR